MPTFHSHSRLLSAGLSRVIALLCAGLMGLLSLASVSPDVHALLHGDCHEATEPGKPDREHGHPPAPDHVCAVTLFGQGLEPGFPSAHALTAPLALCPEVLSLADQVARSARTAQLPPGRGPPLC